MSNVNATTKSASATYFTFDHFNHKIIGSELNFKKSGIPGSAQYNALMTAMERHPNYSLSAVAPNVKKQTYAGLTMPLMEEYLNLVYSRCPLGRFFFGKGVLAEEIVDVGFVSTDVSLFLLLSNKATFAEMIVFCVIVARALISKAST